MRTFTDEELKRAAEEVDEAILDQLPDPADCHHDFSPEFEQKMAATICRIWDEDTQRYL